MKSSITFVACFLIAFCTNAQFSFGIKAGANVNDMVMKPNRSNPYTSGIGFHGGVFGKVHLDGKFSVMPELQFAQRGASDHKLNYIELPVFLAYDVLDRLSIDFGLTLSYMLSAFVNGEKRDWEDKYKMDLGLTGGIRFHLTDRMAFTGRYYHGLCKISEIGDDFSSIISSRYTRTVQLGLAYKIN